MIQNFIESTSPDQQHDKRWHFPYTGWAVAVPTGGQDDKSPTRVSRLQGLFDNPVVLYYEPNVRDYAEELAEQLGATACNGRALSPSELENAHRIVVGTSPTIDTMTGLVDLEPGRAVPAAFYPSLLETRELDRD